MDNEHNLLQIYYTIYKLNHITIEIKSINNVLRKINDMVVKQNLYIITRKYVVIFLKLGRICKILGISIYRKDEEIPV